MKHLSFHNGMAFDSIVLRAAGLLDVESVSDADDTIYMAHALAPERPKKLEYLGALYTPFVYWKDEGKSGEEGENVPDEQMRRYCGIDTQAQNISHEELFRRLDPTDRAVYEHLLRLGELGHRMTWLGMRVDPAAREAWAKRLQARKLAAAIEIEKIGKHFGVSLFSKGPGNKITFSKRALRDLLFRKLKLPVLERTDTGLEKIDKGTLRALREISQIEEAAKLIDQCLAYGAAEKLDSNYATGLPVHPDGFVHPIWKPGLAETLRWKSAKPNGQNIPPVMRELFVPDDEDSVWVEADGKQIEFRMVWAITDCKFIEEAFAKGDPYTPILLRVFKMSQEQYDALKAGNEKDRVQAKALRVLTKKLIHGSDYGGGARTIWGQMVQAVDDEGRLVAPNLALTDVEKLVEEWHKATPEIDRHVKRQQGVLSKLGYIPSVVMGAKRRYPGGAKYTEVANDPYQRTTGELVNRNMLELDKQLQQDKIGTIRAQTHDGVLINVRKSKADLAAKITQEHMEAPIEINGKSWSFPFDVEVKAQAWHEPKKDKK